MRYYLRIDGIIETSTKRQVIDGIKEIRLPCSIVTNETIQVFRQRQICRLNVLEMKDGYIL
jgi:hypothetical protein